MPNDPYASRDPYGTNGVRVRAIYVHWWIALPDGEDIGPLERPAFLVVETAVIVVA